MGDILGYAKGVEPAFLLLKPYKRPLDPRNVFGHGCVLM